MSDLLPTIAAYVPPSVVEMTLSEDSPRPLITARAGFLEAAVLFADVSGFTPLTEILAQKGAEGPEELTRLLNGYFSRMIALIEAEGGEVVKFSGDAVTVVFPIRQETLGHAVRRAKQAAEAMQAAMSEFAILQTSMGTVELGMKIGIGAGNLVTAQVGGVLKRWEYVVAGDPLSQVVAAEHVAKRGDIVLSPEAEAIIHPHALPARPLVRPNWTNHRRQSDQIEAILRCYVPGAVTAWLQRGKMQKWLAVLRPMTVLFIGVNGLDYMQPGAVDRLHLFLCSAQKVIYHYEGSINKLAVDDKGTIFIALFGAPPFAHENDPERALRCALDLQEMIKTQNLQLAIGVTTGRVFAGPVGSDARREYTVMGDTVNLAARLMEKAGLNEIRCDQETYRLARAWLEFDELPPVHLKGKANPIPLYRPLKRLGRQSSQTPTGSSSLIGRKAEMAKLIAGLDDLEAGRSRILVLEGEAGIGKSRLVEELTRLAREYDVTGLVGMGRGIEQQTPYRAWRDIFTSYFGLEDVEDQQERQQRVLRQVEVMAPNLASRTPLLNDILHLGLPENELTTSLNTQTRSDSLISLLLGLLYERAAENPLMLILEDAHWLDTMSWDLTLQVARSLSIIRSPLFLVVAMRPLRRAAERPQPTALAQLNEVDKVTLDALSAEDTVALAAARLGLGQRGLPKVVADLVLTRADGNPFFAEELIYMLRDNGLITLVTEGDQPICRVSGELDEAVQTLSDTIQGVVLSRIDRLPPEEQLTLRVASVIGRLFSYTILYETLSQHTEVSEEMLRVYLDDLERLDLTPIEAPEPELTYIFKHIITQEVAYKTLLFSQRRQLHQTVAEWYERKYGDGDIEPPAEGLASMTETLLTPFYPLLVHHWHQAGDKKREQHYAWLAGQHAAAQFANADAEDYFNRALDLTPTSDYMAQYQLLGAREAVNDLRGDREAQAQDLPALALLAQVTGNKRWKAEVALRRANYAENISDYPTSLAAAQQAVEYARLVSCQALEIEGYIAWGKVLWRQGDYEAAQKQLKRALSLVRATNSPHAEAKSLYYLGNAYYHQEEYDPAKEYYQQALDIYQLIGHRQGEAAPLNMLGSLHYKLRDLSAALNYFQKALTIFQSIGDRRGETFGLGNLGIVYCDLGDFVMAKNYQEQSLDLRRSIGDRWGEGLSLTNLAITYHCLGDYRATLEKGQQALAIQREIGDRNDEGYSLTYLGHALTSLGEFETAATAYEEALELRRQLGEHSAAIDDLAGLARVAMAQHHLENALVYVEEILAWLKEHGSDGIEYPLQVYLTCYQVLQLAGSTVVDERADTILTKAHTLLMEQAASISDRELRRSFLENIPFNRDILTAWRESHPVLET